MPTNDTPTIDPAVLAAIDPAVLAAALAAANDRIATEAAATVAADRIAAAVRTALEHAAALTAGADAAGLTAPDLTAVLHAAMTRATPIAPESLAAVVDPAPERTPAGARRTRRRIERTWENVPRGSVWECSLAGQSGRVKVYVNGGRPTFTAMTGATPGQAFSSPSRAVQAATGNPSGAGRRGEATVNGFLALTRDGRTLDEVTTPDA